MLTLSKGEIQKVVCKLMRGEIQLRKRESVCINPRSENRLVTDSSEDASVDTVHIKLYRYRTSKRYDIFSYITKHELNYIPFQKVCRCWM